MASNRGFVLLLVVAALVAAPLTASALTCGQIFSTITPCINYLRIGGQCPPACCAGVRGLVAASRTTPDRQAACNCLKNVANNVKGVNFGRAAALPGLCGAKVPYKISPATDCSKVR